MSTPPREGLCWRVGIMRSAEIKKCRNFAKNADKSGNHAEITRSFVKAKNSRKIGKSKKSFASNLNIIIKKVRNNFFV